MAKPDVDHHDHSHDGGSPSHSLLPSDPALRVKAMETLLTKKGLIDPAAVDAIIDQYEHKLGPKIGAAVVAKAWADPAFKTALMENAPKALAGLGIAGNGVGQLIALEIPRRSITSSFVRYAPAIRGACWACRPCGTNPRRIARVSCANLARCLPNSASTCRQEPRFAFGI